MVSRDDAEREYGDYLPRLDRVFQRAGADLNIWLASAMHTLTPRTIANVMYDFIVSQARREFDQDREITFATRRGLLLMYIRSALVLRFKKLSNGLRGSSIPTEQAIQYPMQQLVLSGMPAKAPRCVAGYKMNPLSLEVTATYLTLPTATGIDWAIRLDDQGEERTAGLTWPTPGAPAPLRKARTKRAKKGSENEQGTKSASSES